jgi:hypothetical protein
VPRNGLRNSANFFSHKVDEVRAPLETTIKPNYRLNCLSGPNIITDVTGRLATCVATSYDQAL